MGGSADVGTIVACRGLMHANDPAHSTGKHSWRPLHKPEWLQVNKKVGIVTVTIFVQVFSCVRSIDSLPYLLCPLNS